MEIDKVKDRTTNTTTKPQKQQWDNISSGTMTHEPINSL